MAAMPEAIAKGPILKRLEGRYRERAKLQDRIDALKNASEDLATLGRKRGVLTETEAKHLRDDWFSKTGWWPGAHPIEPIVRWGLITALEEAMKRNLPLDASWVCSNEHSSFQVDVTWSDQQLTVLFNSPPVPEAYQDNPLAPDPSFLVQEGSSGATATHTGGHYNRRRTPPAFVNADEPIIIVKRVRELLDTDRVLIREYDKCGKGVSSYIVAIEPKNLLALEAGLPNHDYASQE